MIKEILMRDIRLFEGPDEWRVPISPLTVFCGTNSAGKSTVLKVLLLLCQSHSEVESINRVGRLRLTGGLVDFGNYESFVSHNDVSKDVVLGITTADTVEFRHLQTLQEIVKGSASEPLAADAPVDYELSVRFRCGLREAENRDGTRENSVSRDRGNIRQAFLKEATFELIAAGDVRLTWKIISNSQSGGYHMIVPRDFLDASQPLLRVEPTHEKDPEYASVEVMLRGMLPTGFLARSKAKEHREIEADTDRSFFPLPSLIGETTRNLELEFIRVHYLGPLRSPAQRYYMTNLEDDPTMDTAGEFLPYVLRDQQDHLVYVAAPGASTAQRRPLRYALDSWMYYLRTGEKVEADADNQLHEIGVASMKDVLIEFKVKTFGGEAHGLADSGFGYSQLLPIVVRGLIAPSGGMLVVEQPELHLNPALQVRLAEFLVSLVATGKCVLIETHSEHIVNSIRALSAEDSRGQLAANSKILYIDTENGKPDLKQLGIQPNGTIPNWPRRFFGEALTLSARLLRAQTNKGKR